MPNIFWAWAAELVLVTHWLFVLFVVGGLLLIWLGKVWNWRWVRHRGFRWLHLAAIGVVVAQSWLGQICPLTRLEQWLRQEAEQSGFQGSFIAHYLNQWLYFQAPWWAFVLAYTGFGLLVLFTWWYIPPTGNVAPKSSASKSAKNTEIR